MAAYKRAVLLSLAVMRSLALIAAIPGLRDDAGEWRTAVLTALKLCRIGLSHLRLLLSPEGKKPQRIAVLWGFVVMCFVFHPAGPRGRRCGCGRGGRAA